MNVDELTTLPAVFSPCRTYRYSLRRDIGGPAGPVLFVLLNPSTADETQDDPTIRRCIGFATSWGASVLYIANLFALRSTDPKVMRRHPSPVGPENAVAILMLASEVHRDAGIIVAGWGAHGSYMDRSSATADVLRAMVTLHHLGLTKHGEPRHPLYLRSDTPLTEWEA